MPTTPEPSGGDRPGPRPLRADAQRNRERLLEAAYLAFAQEGLGVSVHEIARRAGVSSGTLSRHFPTKDDLYRAIVHDRVRRLVEQARELRDTMTGAEAFFGFFEVMADATASDRGLADALAGAGFDVESAAAGTGHDVIGALAGLLSEAQESGAVGADIDVADVKALIAACSGRGTDDPEARRRMIRVASDGLRASVR
ncbi:TetR/AcrR family transcriptional regulator [Nocardioides sp.]|uniref:TetR/AcrR family transcriptional regulator n=1 Tax=Nocardioides sp. TaxID=35761 RepID=UPI001A33E2C5|nr:TetR/AcrR family transcriptional regulator [Nocardioides sp.]MBJ7355729.1 TetR/AcrR family transcriptional regulator [Nocardioides sp.]